MDLTLFGDVNNSTDRGYKLDSPWSRDGMGWDGMGWDDMV
jgi:hypothetical protein